MQLKGNPESVVQHYIERINSHDPVAITELNSSDHVLIDSLGTSYSNSTQLKQGWHQYFALFPDYRIQVSLVASSGDSVVACGTASATHAPSGISWCIPAAWRAKVVDGHIAEWQIFADNKPVYEILAGSA